MQVFKKTLVTSLFFSFAFVCGVKASADSCTHLVPLNKKDWTQVSYNKIPANDLQYKDNKMLVSVVKSASPIVHRLSKTLNVNQICFTGAVLSGEKASEQGRFDEDSVLRIGLVAVGNNTLSGVKSYFAADWVKTLFQLAPAGQGLDKIYFFNLSSRAEIVGQQRSHPKSELIFEQIIAQTPANGRFQLNHRLKAPIQTAAIWLSIDGDQTNSRFTTELSALALGYNGDK